MKVSFEINGEKKIELFIIHVFDDIMPKLFFARRWSLIK